MSLCSWVNVVVAKMTAIDRAAKQVVVSREKVVLYDHLILCTGRQYQGSSRGLREAGRGDGSRGGWAHIPGPRVCLPSARVTRTESSWKPYSKKAFFPRVKTTANWRNAILEAVVPKSNTCHSPEQNPEAACHASTGN